MRVIDKVEYEAEFGEIELFRPTIHFDCRLGGTRDGCVVE